MYIMMKPGYAQSWIALTKNPTSWLKLSRRNIFGLLQIRSLKMKDLTIGIQWTFRVTTGPWSPHRTHPTSRLTSSVSTARINSWTGTYSRAGWRWPKKFLLNVSLVNYCSKDICLFFFRGDFSLSQDLQMASNTQTVWYLQKTWLAGQKLISRREMKEIFKSQAFELLHKWTGLLVEANPAIFPVGFLSGRKVWQV